MAKLRVRFTFTPELIQEPVIWQLGQKFPIVTNIRRADVREAFGWALLELEGDATRSTRASNGCALLASRCSSSREM